MTKKYLFLSPIAALAMLFGACSDSDTPSLEEEHSHDDLFGGRLFEFIDLSDLDSGEFMLETSEPIDLYPYSNDGMKLSLNTYEEDQTVSIAIPNGYDGATQIIPAYAVGRETGQDRNIIFIVTGQVSRSDEDREDSLEPKLGQFLGKGTDCTQEIGNIKNTPVFQFERIPKNELYITRNDAVAKTTTHTVKEHSFKSLMKSWGLQLGVSGKAAGVTGGCNFGISEKTSKSSEREYMMVSHNEQVTELMLNTVHLESMISKELVEIDSVCAFLNLLNKDFLSRLQYCPKNFDAAKFVEDWGTDVIKQATLGGSYNMIYSREENIYEHEIGVDFSIYAKYGKPGEKESTNILQFLDKLINPSKPDVEGKGSFSYMNSQYFQSSKTECDYFSRGGNANIQDPNEWAKAFTDKEKFNTWVPVSYYVSSDNKEKKGEAEYWPLYTIDQVAKMALDAAELILANAPKKSKFDEQAISLIKNNVAALAEARKEYIAQQELQDTENSPIVLCDVMMVNNPKRRKNGEPEPFVMPDPKRPDKMRTYYPLITNRNFDIKKPSNDKMRGYPLDTNDDVFLASGHVSSHYWYYAMAHANDCNGIRDIQFLTKDEEYGDDMYIGYVQRGDHARHGLSGLLVKQRYLYVMYGDGKDKKNLITAFGIYDAHSDYDNTTHQPASRIIASTVGADIPKNATMEEIEAFRDFWNTNWDTAVMKGYHQFYQGGGVIRHKIYPIISTKPLSTNKFYELKFDTTKWGDKK